MYSRLLRIPKSTFFLFGPRGTGKSTWLTESFPNGERIDLLRSSVLLKYQTNPDLFREEVLALPPKTWILVDEIQKLPRLLDEIHALIFDTKGKYSFAITGSSARQLKRDQANLLAGRALTKKLFPLLLEELKADFDLDTALRWGSLPSIYSITTGHDRFEFLSSYVETYIKEEIQQEAVVRNLPAFIRFLKVASILNGEILNLSAISRDVGVARSTVQGYFDVFLDTLLGFYLPAYQPKAKVKEIAHPKFYWFDLGVLRVLQGKGNQPIDQSEKGKLFESFILNELIALNHYTGKAGEFYYWRTESGNEVDCIWVQGSKKIGIEIKASSIWDSRFNSGLDTLQAERKIESGYGVYTGTKSLKQGKIWIFPYQEFLSRFSSDQL